MKKNYAHSTGEEKKRWQPLKDHLINTAEITKNNSAKFGASNFGYLLGLLHDIGKYSKEFQNRIRGSKIQTDHSSAGAIEAVKYYGHFGKILAYCIAGHHSGLHDSGNIASIEGTLFNRLQKGVDEIGDYSAYKSDISLDVQLDSIPIKAINGESVGFSLSFFIRMLYSSLVDADFLETETFMRGFQKERVNTVEIDKLLKLLNNFYEQFVYRETKINRLRNEILIECLKESDAPKGLYSLTVPTGGGKTYSSLAFALNHAKKNGQERIIYVIPYTSIIEQNAQNFKKILGEHVVLEHHSNFDFDKELEDITVKQKLKYASENWDIPLIVTTNVQFFESLYANKSSKCRKLHNIINSVIVFDEAQMIPVDYLKPSILAICELVKNYKVTAILCTATQPSIKNLLPNNFSIKEIMSDPKYLYREFKKVDLKYLGDIDDDLLAEKILNNKQALCILNTRKHVRELFEKVKHKGAYHLSTFMCPVHRSKTIAKMKEQLSQNEKCIVVSTQLIEAGVDIDFPAVFRSMTGLDSLVQSAGRCNREGNLRKGYLQVFKPTSEHAKLKGYLAQTAKIGEIIINEFEDPFDLSAIKKYFELLYDIKGNSLDKKNILDYFEKGRSNLNFEFESAANEFKFIESNTHPIIIPFDLTAKKEIRNLEFNPYPTRSLRKLQSYTVTVYDNEFKKLLDSGELEIINEKYYVLKENNDIYCEETGLNIPDVNYGEAIFI